jgi:hypothetical protein
MASEASGTAGTGCSEAERVSVAGLFYSYEATGQQ